MREVKGGTEDVRSMYERFPFPPTNPKSGDGLFIHVPSKAYFAISEGGRALDAGCGTGVRFLGMAKTFPQAELLGIDMTAHSVQLAQETARIHGITNARIERANLMEFDTEQRFHLVTSFGVIHSVQHPQRGVSNLARLLEPDGLLWLWLYHPYGEFDRMLDRELLHRFWSDKSDLETGVSLMQELGLRCDFSRYGGSDAAMEPEDKTTLDVDAFVNPIVTPFDFRTVLRMFRDAGLTWGTIELIQSKEMARWISLNDDPDPIGLPTLRGRDLFQSPKLLERWERMSPLEKLEAMELRTRPTAYVAVGGRGACGLMGEHNLVELGTLE
jgi:SAM-dependent methyltransferase